MEALEYLHYCVTAPGEGDGVREAAVSGVFVDGFAFVGQQPRIHLDPTLALARLELVQRSRAVNMRAEYQSRAKNAFLLRTHLVYP